jgi:2-amino-4-hydroxy-6-hydroxymethyldihydropteridine diphosphokinase
MINDMIFILHSGKEGYSGMFVYLSLGSNLGDRLGYLSNAIGRLAHFMTIDQVSPIYESAAMYVVTQPAYLNMVVQGETSLAPHELLIQLQSIEVEIGRDRSPTASRYGPRLIDIDIVLLTTVLHPIHVDEYIQVDTPMLKVPHSRLHERAFVLIPLDTLTYVDDLLTPLYGKSLSNLIENVKDQEIQLFSYLPIRT